MADHLTTIPFDNAKYNDAIDDCRVPDGACSDTVKYTAGSDTCAVKFSDHETKTELVFWDQNKPDWSALTPAELKKAPSHTMPEMNSSQYNREEWYRAFDDASENMLVSTLNFIPFMLSDWDAMEEIAPGGPDYASFNPGRRVTCEPFTVLIDNYLDQTNEVLPTVTIAPRSLATVTGQGTYLLLDVSGSMNITDNVSLKTAADEVQDAARQIYHQATFDSSGTRKLGVATYSDNIAELLAYGTHPAISTLGGTDPLGAYQAASGWTDLNLALQHGEQELVADHGTDTPGTEIMLMSDGRQTVACPDGIAGCEFDTADRIWDQHSIIINPVSFGNTNEAAMAGLRTGVKRDRASTRLAANSLHRMKMSLTNQYIRSRGRTQLLSESGVLPVTGSTYVPDFELSIHWRTTTVEVPEGVKALFASAHPKYAPGETVGIQVLPPGTGASIVQGGFGNNETMTHGDFAAVTLHAPVSGTYEVTTYAFHYDTDGGVYGLFDAPLDIVVWAEGAPIHGAVWTDEDVIDGSQATDIPIYARASAPRPLTDINVSVDVIGSDDSEIASLSMYDDGVAPDRTAADGVYTATLSSTGLQLAGLTHFTVRGHFDVPVDARAAPNGVRSRHAPPAYLGGAIELFAEKDVAINYAAPETYRADIDLSNFGGGSVGRNSKYVGTIRVKNAAPAAAALDIATGPHVRLDNVRRMSVDGWDGIYAVSFTVLENAAIGTRDLRVSFGSAHSERVDYIEVVAQGADDFGATDTQTELSPEADTLVRSWLPNIPHGNRLLLAVGSNALLNNDRSLLKFSQAALESAANAGELRSVILELSVANQDWFFQDGRKLAVHRVNMPWSEANATWRCANDYGTWNFWEDCQTANRWSIDGQGSRPDAFELSAHSWSDVEAFATETIRLDVTGLALEWLDDPSSNHGLALSILGNPWAEWVNFWSSESLRGPRLVVSTY